MSDKEHPGSAVTPAANGQRPTMRLIVVYVAMLAAGVLVYLMVRQVGLGLTAPADVLNTPAAATASARPEASPSTLYRLLLALVVVTLCARGAGAVCRRIHQPPVIGEVVAGILLGPSLLGLVAPGAMNSLFPPTVVTPLGMIAQLGVILFMFLIGVELNVSVLREQSRSALAISHASIVVPFVLGSALSLYLYPRLSSSSVSFTAFSLFLGVSMSVTAFPVLARILTDRGLHRSRLGVLALTCAAVDDATAWCLLAFVVGVVQARVGGAALTAALTIAYIAVMVWGVRPLVRWMLNRFEAVDTNRQNGQSLMAFASVGLLVSCLATERIGIHAIFGAFLFGALIPHDSRAAETLHVRLYDLVVVLLLPAFFALTGLRTQIGLVEGAHWVTCGLIVLVAFAGKFGGSSVAARLTGLTWRDAGALGILMNTRGLMELIVLNVGLDLGVISPRLFTMLVIMALVATFATAPILDRVTRKEWRSAADS